MVLLKEREIIIKIIEIKRFNKLNYVENDKFLYMSSIKNTRLLYTH